MGRHSRSHSRSHSRGRVNAEDAYDSEQDGYRVHIADLGMDASQKDVERYFSKFGETREIWLARNPPCFAFIVYKHKGDAEEAIKEMDGRTMGNTRVRVSFARPRTRGRTARFESMSQMRCFACGEKGHFSRDCGNRGGRGGGGRHDDDRRTRRRSRSRSRSRDRRRRSHRRSHSRSRSRSPKRTSRRSRSRSQSRDKRRRHRSRSNDRHRRRSHTRSRSNDRKDKETRRHTRSRSPKVANETNGIRTNGETANGTSETNGNAPTATANGNGHSRSRSSSRHSVASHKSNPTNPASTIPDTNNDIYDPTKTDDEDEFNGSKDDAVNGVVLNGMVINDTIITDYNSEVDEREIVA